MLAAIFHSSRASSSSQEFDLYFLRKKRKQCCFNKHGLYLCRSYLEAPKELHKHTYYICPLNPAPYDSFWSLSQTTRLTRSVEQQANKRSSCTRLPYRQSCNKRSSHRTHTSPTSIHHHGLVPLPFRDVRAHPGLLRGGRSQPQDRQSH